MWTNQTKTAATYSNTAKSSTSYTDVLKGGQGWLYDQSTITYDINIDPQTGNPVYYDGVGTVSSWVNKNK